jgi:hypothetical protein
MSPREQRLQPFGRHAHDRAEHRHVQRHCHQAQDADYTGITSAAVTVTATAAQIAQPTALVVSAPTSGNFGDKLTPATTVGTVTVRSPTRRPAPARWAPAPMPGGRHRHNGHHNGHLLRDGDQGW